MCECKRIDRPAVSSLQATFPAEALYVCEKCLGPLEPVYDYSAIKVTREEIERRPKNLWRYRELLPITGEPRTGFNSGFTPLVRCDAARRTARPQRALHQRRLGQPSDARRTKIASCRLRPRAPSSSDSTCSRARRPAISPTASRRTPRGSALECCVFIPDNLEAGKVLGSAIYRPTILAIAGNYDDVNRLCTQVGGQVRLGVRQHQPAVVLRRRRQDHGLRDRRAARMALSRARRLARRRRHAAAAHSARDARAAKKSAWCRASCPHVHAAQAEGCAPVMRALERGPRASRASAARYDREVDRDRQPG